jgi:TRAP-type C4-dicarboxylate transport system substrate-binding protein
VSSIAIEFGGYQPLASIHNRAAQFFCQHLIDNLGDEIRLGFDGNIIDSGHKAADLLTMVEVGAKSLCYFSTSYLVERVPEFGLFDLPFVIRDREQAYTAMDGPLGQILANRLEASSGFKLLGLWDNGFRHFTNRLRPIHEPADCKHMRIRTLFSNLHCRVFQLLGFEPVALDVKDLIAGVIAGSIDAQENPLTNTYNFGVHEHHRHITLSSHFFGIAGFLCHSESYQSWPAHVQHAVIEVAGAATAHQRSLAATEDAEILPLLKHAGAEIVHLSNAERTQFVDAVASIFNDQRKILGDDLIEHLG